MGSRFLILLFVSVGMVVARPSGTVAPENDGEITIHVEDAEQSFPDLVVEGKETQLPGATDETNISPDEPIGADQDIPEDTGAAQKVSNVANEEAAGDHNVNQDETILDTNVEEISSSISPVVDVEFTEEVTPVDTDAQENGQESIVENESELVLNDGVTTEERKISAIVDQDFIIEFVTEQSTTGFVPTNERNIDEATIGQQNAARISPLQEVPTSEQFVVGETVKRQDFTGEGKLTLGDILTNVEPITQQVTAKAQDAVPTEESISVSTTAENNEAVVTTPEENVEASGTEEVSVHASFSVEGATEENTPAATETELPVEETNTQNVEEERTVEQEVHAEHENGEELSEQTQGDQTEGQTHPAEERESVKQEEAPNGKTEEERTSEHDEEAKNGEQ